MVDRKTPATKKSPLRKGRSPISKGKSAPAAVSVKSELEPVVAPLTAADPIMQTELREETVEVSSGTPSSGPALPTAAESAQTPPKSPTQKSEPRILDVFLLDSGWNNVVSAAVHENIPAVAAYLTGHRFFVLNHEQSLHFIKRQPKLVGADPLLLVLDRQAARNKNPAGYGFRLSLGHVRQPEVAISMLKWAIQLTMTASTSEMTNMVRKSGHRESLQGVIELVGEGSAHLLEFAPV